MGKYIVTGGAGFIGSHLAKKLVSLGHEVLILDDLSTGRKENLPEKTDFIQIDLSRQEEIDKIPSQNYTGVLHLAAQSSGEISFEDPYKDYLINSGSTLLLLDWCLKNKVNRFFYSSSMSIYGGDDNPCKQEDSPCHPNSFYGISKLASENYIRLFGKMGINYTIFRLFNVYGPGQNIQNLKQGMVSIYLAYILQNNPILVKGSWERFRDLTYIDDVIEAWIMTIDDPKTFGKTYNLATGKKTTVRELLNLLLENYGLDRSYPIVNSSGTPGDVFGYTADINSIQSDIAWNPRYGIKKGLKMMTDYYRKEPNPKGKP